MDARVKELVESAEEISGVSSARGGAWDYEGLAEALRQMLKNPGARKLRVDKILLFHSTGELVNKAHYAKKAIEKAVELNGWTLKNIATRNKEYVLFEVDF